MHRATVSPRAATLSRFRAGSGLATTSVSYLIALDWEDERNHDRGRPNGDRLRVEIDVREGILETFAVQYETPIPLWADPPPDIFFKPDGQLRSHCPVPRSDSSHPPHYDMYRWDGTKQRRWLDSRLTGSETIKTAIDEIQSRWPALRDDFYRGMP